MSMKATRILILAATATIIGASSFAATASAQQTIPLQKAPQAQRISASQLMTKLEQAGYTIRDLEHKRYGWEAEVLDRHRYKYELKLDMQGNLISRERD